MDEEKRFEELLGSYSEKAKDMLSEEGKVEEILKKAEETLAGIPNVGEKASKLPLMFSMIRSYITKEYTEVSPKVIASMFGAFIYLVSRKDLIPDKIPVLGMADDLGVLALALELNKPELDAYLAWRDNRKNTVTRETPAADEKTEA